VATAQTESARAAGLTKHPSPKRLVSSTRFAARSIALMVLVNDPGDGVTSTVLSNHAEWNGWTITGRRVPVLSVDRRCRHDVFDREKLAAGNSRGQIFMQVLRRAADSLWAGVVPLRAAKFDLSTLRILGVLQRIAICYAIAAAIYLTTGVRGQINLDRVPARRRSGLIMTFAPVPGIGSGYLDVERNFAHYVDSMTLGHHNYHRTKTWDPEGHRQHTACYRHSLAGHPGRNVAALEARAGGAHHLDVRRRKPAHRGRPDLRHLAADQQEDLDQLFRTVHGGPGFRDAGPSWPGSWTAWVIAAL